MTLLGDILGYDSFGGDIMGVNRDNGQNCIVCGLSVFHHPLEITEECTRKYYIELKRQHDEIRRQRRDYYRQKYPKV